MQHFIPKIKKPGGGRFVTFHSLASAQTLMKYRPHFVEEYDPSQPRRKNMVAPFDKGTFVKPVKQCFVKNPRTMPMTRIMLALLTGWAGQGGCIETTVGIIGKHLSRCRRQVFRYLKDAVEEGYLSYTKTKDRIGRYTGIKIWLNFAAIRFTTYRKPKKAVKPAETVGVTLKAETNGKYIYNRVGDAEMRDALERLGALIENKSDNTS